MAGWVCECTSQIDFRKPLFLWPLSHRLMPNLFRVRNRSIFGSMKGHQKKKKKKRGGENATITGIHGRRSSTTEYSVLHFLALAVVRWRYSWCIYATEYGALILIQGRNSCFPWCASGITQLGWPARVKKKKKLANMAWFKGREIFYYREH